MNKRHANRIFAIIVYHLQHSNWFSSWRPFLIVSVFILVANYARKIMPLLYFFFDINKHSDGYQMRWFQEQSITIILRQSLAFLRWLKPSQVTFDFGKALRRNISFFSWIFLLFPWNSFVLHCKNVSSSSVFLGKYFSFVWNCLFVFGNSFSM